MREKASAPPSKNAVLYSVKYVIPSVKSRRLALNQTTECYPRVRVGASRVTR